MRYVLKLEMIGDFYAASFDRKCYQNTGSFRIDKRLIESMRYGNKNLRPFVQRVTSATAEGFVREMIHGERDYTNATANGNFGIFEFYFLSPGVYEIGDRVSLTRLRVYFLNVVSHNHAYEIKDTEIKEILA